MNTGLPSGSPLDWVESRLSSAVRTVCFKIVPCRVRAAALTPLAASLPACRRRASNGREGAYPANSARDRFWALVALIVFGIAAIFVRIPHGELICSVLGLVVFAGLTMVDFQRLRRSSDLVSAPLLAASIFLDALNVFLFFLRSFSRGG
jgi:hypothetical protein